MSGSGSEKGNHRNFPSIPQQLATATSYLHVSAHQPAVHLNIHVYQVIQSDPSKIAIFILPLYEPLSILSGLLQSLSLSPLGWPIRALPGVHERDSEVRTYMAYFPCVWEVESNVSHSSDKRLLYTFSILLRCTA